MTSASVGFATECFDVTKTKLDDTLEFGMKYAQPPIMRHDPITTRTAQLSKDEHFIEESAPIRALFDTLNERGVSYCHWKSNIRLPDTLSGKEDIDVLVNPIDAKLLIAAATENGFKLAVARHGVGHPGVFHAVALDEISGRLVDLHVYYQLISGDSYTKAYRFPLEKALLAATTTARGVKVPIPPAEMVIFLVRILLKHTSAVEVLKVNRKYHKTVGELNWLLERSSLAHASELCRDWFPQITVSVEDMIECVASTRKLPSRILNGYRTAWALRSWRRVGWLAAQISRCWRAARYALNFANSRRDLSLQAGGAWIAFAGPKGSGKSTQARLLANRLGQRLDVITVHFGRPPPTLLSYLPRLFVPLARALLPSERLSEYEKPQRRASKTFSMLHTLRVLLLAHDRRRMMIRASRSFTAGAIVISDRCPPTDPGGVDGSAFDDLAIANASSALKRWLMRKERRIYQMMPKPRLVLQLVTDEETAIQRDLYRVKPGGPNTEAIRRRWALEKDARFNGSTVVRIDAQGDIDATFRTVLLATWHEL
jgi:thymidylate kinase